MSTFLAYLGTNALWATMLAPLAWLISRWTGRPRLAHAVWVILLVRLVIPLLLEVELPWAATSAVARVLVEEATPQRRPSPPPVSPIGEPSASAAITNAPGPESKGFDWLTALFAVWSVGALGWITAAGCRIWSFQRLVPQAALASPSLQARTAQCAELIGLSACPIVRIIEGRIPPMVWAITSPVVLIPQTLLSRLGTDQLDAILVHELAHILRRDHWTRRFELLVGALQWWNPIAWLVRSQIREAEEACCDAIVARTFVKSQKRYSQALLETIAFLGEDRVDVPVAASSFGGTKSIRRRLSMILKGRLNDRLGWREGTCFAAMSLCLLVGNVTLTAGPQTDNAKTQNTETAEQPNPDLKLYDSLARSFVTQIRDPRRLADAQEVRSLGLDGPRINDTALEQIARFTNLEELGLIGTNVKGPGMAHLKGLDRLEALTLVGPDVTDAWLEALPSLEKLKILRLWNTRVSKEGLSRLDIFPNLEQLILDGTPLRDGDLAVLPNLPHLKDLSLKYTNVSDKDLAALERWPTLESFRLGSTRVKGPGLSHLSTAKNLRSLQFVGQGATDEWMRNVEALRNVEWLELHTTRITSQGLIALKEWSRLKTAYLNNNPIDDSAVPHLESLFRLDLIELNGTKITAQGVARLGDALPDARVGFSGVDETPTTDPYGNHRGAN